MRLTCTSGGPARSCGSPSGSWDSGRRPPQTGAASLSSRSWAHWRAPLLSSRRSAGLHRRHRNADDACCQRAVQHRGKAVPSTLTGGHGEAGVGAQRPGVGGASARRRGGRQQAPGRRRCCRDPAPRQDGRALRSRPARMTLAIAGHVCIDYSYRTAAFFVTFYIV